MKLQKEGFSDYIERVDKIETVIGNETSTTNTSGVSGTSTETPVSNCKALDILNEIMLIVETKLDKQFETTQDVLKTLTVRTNDIETDQFNDREMIKNSTLRVLRLETVIDSQTLSAELEDKLIHLESDINKTQSDLKDNKIKINVLEENITSVMLFSNDQLQRNSEMESKLTSIQDTINNYNQTVETLKVKCK